MEPDLSCRNRINSGYIFIKKLGSGLFGTCYLCKNNLGDSFVLKKYNPDSFQINQGKNHYEAAILSTLSHQAIPKFYGMLHMDDEEYLILEYKPGDILKTFLFQNHKVYDDSEISRICTKLLSVMEYLHKRDILHRDISIDNIIDDGTDISLVDFGLSRPIRYEEVGAQIDYYCFGEVLLFLLYSRYTKTNRSNGASPWYDELKLTVAQKQFIGKLLRLEKRFNSVAEITGGFVQFMKKGLPARL